MDGMLPGLVEMVQKKCGIAPECSATVNTAQVTNSAKVSDHHAIIPTKTLEDADLSELPHGELSILMLIATRLIVAVAEPYRYQETNIELDCAGHVFKTKGRTILSPGWKAYTGKYDEKAQEPNADLPVLQEQAELPLASVEIKEGRNSPPKHFTEDLLLSTMETSGTDEILEEAERKGIVTLATRAGIIEKLVQKGFVERKDDRKTKILVPTSKDEILVTVVPETVSVSLPDGRMGGKTDGNRKR